MKWPIKNRESHKFAVDDIEWEKNGQARVCIYILYGWLFM